MMVIVGALHQNETYFPFPPLPSTPGTPRKGTRARCIGCLAKPNATAPVIAPASRHHDHHHAGSAAKRPRADTSRAEPQRGATSDVDTTADAGESSEADSAVDSAEELYDVSIWHSRASWQCPFASATR